MSEDTSIAANREQAANNSEGASTRRTFLRGVGAGVIATGIGATGSATAAPTNGSELRLDLRNLPDLSAGHYEGWAIFGGEKVSTGTFASGGMHTMSVDRDLTAADKIVVTIEPDDDSSAAPSGVVVLAGSVDGDMATLSLPIDLGSAAGSYILATPTDGPGNDESGVWFLEPGQPKSASLDLPDLSEQNWTYEGWIVHGGQPISTGRFDDPAAADGSMAYAGDANSPPPFPGADLIQNAPDGLSFPTDLTDGNSKAVISVEPDIDGTDPTGPSPFALTPLVGSIPAAAQAKTSHQLNRPGKPVPSGTARLKSGGSTDSPTLSVGLSMDSIGTNGTATATISLSRAPMGVDSFALNVTSADASVVAIEDASLTEQFAAPSADAITIAPDGSSVNVSGLDAEMTV